MKQKTSALDYYNAVMQKEDMVDKAGTLFYIAQKPKTKDEFILEALVIDFKNKDLCIKVVNFISVRGHRGVGQEELFKQWDQASYDNLLHPYSFSDCPSDQGNKD